VANARKLNTTVDKQSLEQPTSNAKDIKNQLLNDLRGNERSFILDRLTYMDLSIEHLLLETGDPMAYAYFPNSAMISVLTLMSDGKSVEVGVVGREGFVGLPLLGGFRTSPYRINVQSPGSVFRIGAEDLKDAMANCPQFSKALVQYSQKAALQVTQTAACNRLHEVEERLARWLLMSRDRIDSDDLPLTQEFLGQMLGTRRSSVSLAAASLQKSRLIEYVRGHVTILDRKGLEAASCECYGQLQRQLTTWDSEVQ
jgi:CRP-like cAMP-binding protein